MNPTVEQVSAMFGVPVENIRRQYAKNAAHIRSVVSKLEAGRLVQGYTADDLPMMRRAADEYERKSK